MKKEIKPFNFDEMRAKHKKEPNSNEIHGYTFDLDVLYHCFLQNSKGDIFELWEHREVDKKSDDGKAIDTYALIYAYKLIPQYQGGYHLKPILWHFDSLHEAINKLGKMKLFRQLENSKCGYHTFTSEIYKFMRNANNERSEIETSEFIDDVGLETPF